MADNSISNQIYLSRDKIRNQIIDYIKMYLELENVDLTKSSFLSFIINILSTLTSNLLFYQSSVYREFFLTTAQLPESIFNLSAFLGYNTQEAQYASVNVLMTIPLSFTSSNATFTIPEGFIFKADEIQFVTFYDTEVTVTNNSTVSIVMTDDNKVYNIPYTSTTDDAFQFILPVRQYKENIQEFQIPDDLQTYQFTTIDVPLTGKVSSMVVQVREADSSTWNTYTEFNSLYLMTSTDSGYVSRRSDSGRTLYFGNGLIGVQPPPGGTVKVTILETDGEDGNIIAGSITTGERIYTTSPSGVAQVVSYEVTNPSPATGGEDEESLEDIRTNSIANLTALGRLVSETDYANVNTVISDTPIKDNSIAVLKRSDLNVNEVQLYISLDFNSEVVPTRNIYYEIPIETTYLPRGSVITFDDEQYILLFDMTIDPELNKKAYYEYIMREIDVTPSLVATYNSSYEIIADNLKATRSGDTVTFTLHYQTDESDAGDLSCQMEIFETTELFTMSNDATGAIFTYTFDPYTDLPEGELTFNFTINGPTSGYPTLGSVSKYSSTFTVRKLLDSFMMSNVTVEYVDSTASDSTSITFVDSTGLTTIYDIPVLLKEYYDDLVTEGLDASFELQVLQSMMSSLEFSGYRMLTDFVNVKFTNTYGTMNNMQHNVVSFNAVMDISQTSVPTNPNVGERWIVNGNEGGAWTGKKDKIAQCTDATNITWVFAEPVTDGIVYVASKQLKYIYSESGWVVPTYEIPLQISLEVFKENTSTQSDLELSLTIKENILDVYSSRFGSNISVYRSEIIDIVQSTDGVDHCRLITPESNIFFDYELSYLTQQELLEYSPHYIYFTEDDITIRIL